MAAWRKKYFCVRLAQKSGALYLTFQHESSVLSREVSTISCRVKPMLVFNQMTGTSYSGSLMYRYQAKNLKYLLFTKGLLKFSIQSALSCSLADRLV